MRFVLGAFAVFAVTIGAVLALHAAGYYPNYTDSMPRGLWRATDDPIQRGKPVLVCPPPSRVITAAREAGYLISGSCPSGLAPLLKPVVAVPGDRVAVTSAGVTVNGREIPNSGLLTQDGSGRRLPRAQIGLHTVAPGTVWVVSSFNPYSFDSRYFGPVQVAQVRGVARPIWLLGDS